MDSKFSTVDQYIGSFSPEVQSLLEQIRRTIQAAAPEAEECISYAMPTYKQHGNLVHFAAYKNHIGFYPAPSGLLEFREEITKYPNSKGAVQFPLDQPVPLDLIEAIVRFRIQENLKKAEIKKSKKKCKNGHTFFKISDCPTCPICEKERKPQSEFLKHLGAPARRALENEGIDSLKKLSSYSENDILQLHGIGKASLPILNKLMTEQGLAFK